MPSFEMIYDTEEDVLEVTFEVFEETFARTIALNERILLFTDTSFQSSWGLNFDGYGTLLQVNETVLDGLNALSEPNRLRILQLLAEPFRQLLSRSTRQRGGSRCYQIAESGGIVRLADTRHGLS